jgi:hypothetical protein
MKPCSQIQIVKQNKPDPDCETRHRENWFRVLMAFILLRLLLLLLLWFVKGFEA